MSDDTTESLLAAGAELLRENDAVARMLAKDGSLWSDDATVAALCSQRLGWLDLPSTMPARLPDMTAFADVVATDGFRDVIVCGMGGSGLAPEVFSEVFGHATGRPHVTVLDTTDPFAIRTLEQELDLRQTLFIVSSKSGTTIETDALRRHFTSRLRSARLGVSRHLVAITDAGSELERIATAERWRGVFLSPSDVGGRFSALSPFGLVPAALMGAPVEGLLASAAEQVAALRANGVESGPAALGALLGAAARAGRDKLVLYTSPAVTSLGVWAEQLIAESTGKHGTYGPAGILPLTVDGATGALADRVALRVELTGENAPDVDKTVPALAVALADRSELGGVMLALEAATALASVIIGVEPFDQPDVASSKAATLAVLAGEGERAPFSRLDDLAPAIDAVTDNGYVAILDYMPPGGEHHVEALSERIRALTGAAVTIGTGPRYLHSTGQLHKGGPANGVFVVLEGPMATYTDDDPPIPGKDLTFGQLFAAQAEGDVRALLARGREVVRLRIRDLERLDALLA